MGITHADIEKHRERDRLIARELRPILDRDFRVDHEMSAIAPRDVRVGEDDDLEVR